MLGQHLAGALDELGWQAGQLGHFNAVAAAGGAGLHFAQEDDSRGGVAHRDLEILYPRQPIRQLGQFVVVGGKQGLGAGMRLDVFHRRPRQRQSVKGGGAAPHLIQQDERARSSGVENDRGLGHLHHKGGAAAGQIVAGPDAGEDAVHRAQARAARRHEATHLRHDHHQRRLPQISALAAHIGPG